MSLDIKKTGIRAISGIVYVTIIVLACFSGFIGVTLLAALFASLGVIEFRKMFSDSYPQSPGRALYNAFGAIFLVLAPYGFPIAIWIAWLIGRILITLYSHHLYPTKDFIIDMAAQLYIAFPLMLLTSAGLLEATCFPILGIFILIWINDTGAFIFGSIFGKHKLFERISPNKSWEGFWGGLLCTGAVGLLFGANEWAISDLFYFNRFWFWGFVGVWVSVFSTFGDLFESVIKRNLNLKDSGNLIPGHGGILDRIDSLLLVLPSLALLLLLCLFIETPSFIWL